jgi:hypothetical protein
LRKWASIWYKTVGKTAQEAQMNGIVLRSKLQEILPASLIAQTAEELGVIERRIGRIEGTFPI